MQITDAHEEKNTNTKNQKFKHMDDTKYTHLTDFTRHVAPVKFFPLGF